MLAFEENVTWFVLFVDVGTHSPLIGPRSPMRSNHRAVDVWSKPLRLKTTFGGLPPLPWKLVIHTSDGITAARLVISWVHPTSVANTVLTPCSRWTMSASSFVTPCNAVTWRVRDAC